MLKRKLSVFLVFLLMVMGLCSCQSTDLSKQDIDILKIIDEIAQNEIEEEQIGQKESGYAGNADSGENEATEKAPPTSQPDTEFIAQDGEYTKKEDVALYLHLYGELPSNFITKKEAAELGWEGGSLEPYAPGKSIGGDYFGNYEKRLPSQKGRQYRECDIDTKGKSKRGAKRIIYSNDGLIYYTEDHYETFELLYGEE